MSTSKQTTATSSNATQTPTVPSWITQPLQNQASAISALSNVPASSYVAPQTANQQEANALGASNAATQNPNYAAGAANIAGNSSVGAPQIANFMDPYTSSVVDASNKLFDQNAGMQNANLEAQGAANGAFGGSRFGVAQGILGGQQSLARGQLDSGLLSQGYQSAVTNALNNATLGINAGAAQGNLGTQQNASTVANIAELAGLGGAQQATNQAIATAPISLAQAQGGLLAQLPINSYTGQNLTGQSNSTTTQTPSVLSTLQGLLGGLGSLTSGAGSFASMFAPGGGLASGMNSAGTQNALSSIYAAGGL